MKHFVVAREYTDYLKGFGILAVYANHFINGYVSTSFTGYANGFISIFFILSGYGIFISLTRLSSQGNGSFLLPFFTKRFLRIYPLFWIWCALRGFSNGFLGFFGLDFIEPESPWFIPAIIQCYLLAPILFVAFRNLSIKKSIAIMVPLFIILNFLFFNIIGEPFRTIGYRGLFFQHIFLFFLGFILAKLESLKPLPGYVIFLSILVYLFVIQETAHHAWLAFSYNTIIFSFIFPFATFLFCYGIATGRLYLPLKHTLQSIGQYSYSVYLFHGLGFTLLAKAGLLQKLDTPFIGIIIVILMTPVFISLYAILEIIVDEFTFGKRNIGNVFTKTKQVVFAFNPFHQRAQSATPDRSSASVS